MHHFFCVPIGRKKNLDCFVTALFILKLNYKMVYLLTWQRLSANALVFI